MSLPSFRWLPVLAVSLLPIQTGAVEVQDDAPAARAETGPAEPDAPMPEGFPAPTAPGMVEVKQYPAYRSALVKGKGMNQRSGSLLFFQLFRHIQEREVAMTAPVINTYLDPEIAVDPEATGDLTMEFLYERPDQGEAGAGVGSVEVKDNPPLTVVAVGVQGQMTPAQMAGGMATLRAWLADHEGEWAEAGPPRQLGYNGPMTPAARRHWEVQLPIASVDPAADVADDDAPQDPD